MRIVVQHAVGDPAWHPSVLAPPSVADFARLAERHGYAGIGFTDHPAPTVRWTAAGGEGSADPLVSLAYCAAVTSSIELMTFVLALPYHNPFRLAHQAATLDALSGGRLTLGLGTGYLRGEMRAMGADPGARLASFDAVLETMLTAWTAESVSGSGPGWSARDVHVQPRPV
jgi:alkanesulfonate monooxygenase SsuD/methylene tetrahydromethanopterin reductase-like flavin-dependent oxidoreductase (luciferase family)